MEKTHQETISAPQIDAGRRRLTRAGLAVPAVLGVLASKSVLADVPWNCTISGQVSGNVSSHGEVACTSLGQSQSTLASVYSGAANVTPNKFTKISDVFPDLTTNYFFLTANNLTTDSSKPIATIYEILTKAAPASLLYAQKALVLLLNAKSIGDTSIYPVTEYQAKNLYIAAATGGGFSDTNPTVNWSNLQVKIYIDLLWH
jgi:hypothetical protein